MSVLRFQLPIQLSQEQLQAIRVSYDKDGWMRCLGSDLKFHWVYNKSSSSSSGNETSPKPEHKYEYELVTNFSYLRVVVGVNIIIMAVVAVFEVVEVVVVVLSPVLCVYVCMCAWCSALNCSFEL